MLGKKGGSRTSRRPTIGEWRSLAARLLWEQEVPGSNPGSPTIGGLCQVVSESSLGLARTLAVLYPLTMLRYFQGWFMVRPAGCPRQRSGQSSRLPKRASGGKSCQYDYSKRLWDEPVISCGRFWAVHRRGSGSGGHGTRSGQERASLPGGETAPCLTSRREPLRMSGLPLARLCWTSVAEAERSPLGSRCKATT